MGDLEEMFLKENVPGRWSKLDDSSDKRIEVDDTSDAVSEYAITSIPHDMKFKHYSFCFS